MLNLDTHILLYALNGELSSKEAQLLAKERWSISDIVLWEITKLSQLGKIEIDIEDAEFFRILSQIHIWPISIEVCRMMLKLDIKSDPADEIIAATSLTYSVPLVSRDKKLLRSKLIPLA